MKKILLITAIVSLYSCKKCVTCNQVTTTQVGNQAPQPYSTTTYEFCGTSSEINAQEGTATSTVQQGGVTATATVVTTCY